MAKETSGTKLCKHCKTEIPAGAKVCPNCRKKQSSVLKTVLIVFAVLIALGAIAGSGDEDSENKNVASSETKTKENTIQDSSQENKKEAETNKKEEEGEKQEQEEISFEEVKKEAEELDYKAVMRNPDDYVGKYFTVTVEISTVETGGLFSSYDRAYKAYTNDEYDMWLGDMIYLLDNRNTESEDYTKILEDDIVKVYGRFDGLVETKNYLSGSKGEDMSLQILYAELVSE